MTTSRVILFNVLRFFLLILLQVLILNNIYLGGLINPYFYIYFILLLPYDVPGGLLLLFGFLLGAGVDIRTFFRFSVGESFFVRFLGRTFKFNLRV